MYLKDPNSNTPSVSLTLFVTGFMVCTLKLLTSGVVIGKLHLGDFGGTDFAAAVGALGAIYAARRHTDANAPQSTPKDKEE
jgi:hypothetical protein